jgi:formyl-CoA transferase
MSTSPSSSPTPSNLAPLHGIKVIDLTEVQSGPSCTQMLAWLGAEVIKIERPGVGDATRNELQFDPKLPSYYFLQLNSAKKSLTLNLKTDDGKQILTRLLHDADMFVENLHPGAVEAMGFGWDDVHALNQRCIYGSIKGFPLSSRYRNLKAYEPIAQATAIAASTTGFYDGEANIPTQSGAALGDSNTGMHLLIGLLAALQLRQKTGMGTFVYQSMHNACLNLCRIKTRDQLTLDRVGYLTQFPQYPVEKFSDCVPRGGNFEGSGVMGWTYKCKPAPGTNAKVDANNFVYIILQRSPKEFEQACQAFGFTDWLTDVRFNTADARDRHKSEIIQRISAWCTDKTKFEITDLLSRYGVPVGPVLSTKEVMTDKQLYDGNTLVNIDQGGAIGEFTTVGCPFTMSGFQPDYKPCPTLGGNTAEILTALGYTDSQQAEFAANGTTHPLTK